MQEPQETWVRSLDSEDPLDEGMVNYSRTWQDIVHKVAKSCSWLKQFSPHACSTITSLLSFHFLFICVHSLLLDEPPSRPINIFLFKKEILVSFIFSIFCLYFISSVIFITFFICSLDNLFLKKKNSIRR